MRVTNVAAGLVETNFSTVRFQGDEEKAKAVYSNVAMGGPMQAEDIADCIMFALTRPAEREHRRDRRDGTRPGLGREHPARELAAARRRRVLPRVKSAARACGRRARASTGAVAPSTRTAQPMSVARVPTAPAIGPSAASASGVSASEPSAS